MRAAIRLALAVTAFLAFGGPVGAADAVVHEVTTSRDDPRVPTPGSLRDAVQRLANPGDVIRLAPGVVVALRAVLRIPERLAGLTIEGSTGAAIATKRARGLVLVGADDVKIRDVTFRDVELLTDSAVQGDQQSGVAGLDLHDCVFEGRSSLVLDHARDAVVISCRAEPAASGPVPLRLSRTVKAYIARFDVEGGPGVSFDDSDSDGLFVQQCDFSGGALLSTISGYFMANVVRGEKGIFVVPSDFTGEITPPPGDPMLVIGGNHARRMSVRGTGIHLDQNRLGENAFAGLKSAAGPIYDVVLSVSPLESRGRPLRGDVVVEDNEISGGDTGLRLGDGPAPRFAKTILRGNKITGTRRIGISITKAAQVLAEKNEVYEVNGTGLVIAGTSGPDAAFVENTIGANSGAHPAVAGIGVSVRASHPVKFTGGLLGFSGSHCMVVLGGTGLVTLEKVNVVLAGPDLPEGDGVRVEKKGRAKLVDCTLQSCAGAGLRVEPGGLALVRGGSFAQNHGPGIDLWPPGETPNAVKKPANRGIGFPEQLEIDPETYRLSGVAAPGATVDVWVVERGVRLDDHVSGEGEFHLGSATADTQGRFEFPATGELDCDADDLITTTASLEADGVTSEFSPNIACPVHPNWFRVESGTTQDLTAVWVRANDDAWAVGALGTALHWNGQAWSSIDTGSSDNLGDVVALGPNEVYATGYQQLLKYDGTAWSVALQRPPWPALAGWGNAMWGSADAGLWAAWLGGQPAQVGSRQRFYRSPSDTTTWVSPYEGESGIGYDRKGTPGSLFEGVWGTSASDVWCVTEGGSVYRYDGNAAALADPPSGTHTGRFDLVLHLGAYPTLDLWAGGGAVFVAGFKAFRYDGAQWTQQTFPITPKGSYSVWGNAPDDVWQTADGPFQFAPGVNEAAIFHFDGTEWTRDTIPPLTRPLRRVRGVVGGLRVAVGDRGTILHHK